MATGKAQIHVAKGALSSFAGRADRQIVDGCYTAIEVEGDIAANPVPAGTAARQAGDSASMIGRKCSHCSQRVQSHTACSA